MFLAYISHWDYETLMGMPVRELYRWVNTAFKLHKKMNSEK